jgi:hypothetical protein
MLLGNLFPLVLLELLKSHKIKCLILVFKLEHFIVYYCRHEVCKISLVINIKMTSQCLAKLKYLGR